MNNYCVYFHINPLKNHVFYVGIGKPRRAKEKTSRTKIWKNTVSKYGYIIDVVEDNLTQEQAKEREKFYIKRFGRKDLGLGNLVNLTDGGEGSVNFRHTDESKKIIGLKGLGRIPKNKGIKRPGTAPKTAFKKGFIPWNKGIKMPPMPEATKQKIAKSHIGLNTWTKGTKRDESVKERIRQSLKGRPNTWQKGVPRKKWKRNE